MDSPISFEILFRKKIPYWSELLMGIMVVFFFFLLLLYFIMVPSDKSSDEMKVAYYILVVPEWLKEASAYSFIGLILLIPIYGISKSYKQAVLIIDNNTFTISGSKEDRAIPVESIRKIILNDVKYVIRRPREAIEIIIKQNTGRTVSFLLKHYIQTEELMQTLSVFADIELVFYNELAIETHDE